MTDGVGGHGRWKRPLDVPILSGMIPVTLPPVLVFALAFLAMLLATWIGALLSRRRPIQAAARDDFGTILAATLTLLGLVIGFSFAMALHRYDQRMNDEEAEANASGTAYVRATLLPAADAATMRALLRRYLEQRLLFYVTCDEQELGLPGAIGGKCTVRELCAT